MRSQKAPYQGMRQLIRALGAMVAVGITLFWL